MLVLSVLLPMLIFVLCLVTAPIKIYIPILASDDVPKQPTVDFHFMGQKIFNVLGNY